MLLGGNSSPHTPWPWARLPESVVVARLVVPPAASFWIRHLIAPAKIAKWSRQAAEEKIWLIWGWMQPTRGSAALSYKCLFLKKVAPFVKGNKQDLCIHSLIYLFILSGYNAPIGHAVTAAALSGCCVVFFFVVNKIL